MTPGVPTVANPRIAARRREVGGAPGSTVRARSSSADVIVNVTAENRRPISASASTSRTTRSLFVITCAPKPNSAIVDDARPVRRVVRSNGM